MCWFHLRNRHNRNGVDVLVAFVGSVTEGMPQHSGNGAAEVSGGTTILDDSRGATGDNRWSLRGSKRSHSAP